ncbi:hypothetical protein CETAM_01340 [Corynebacterium comes]|uniref:Uncharacterized protein n=1 Tax=Corynebacterium comes TaxID=2675218 RepID=A0A6B8VQ70_9CORY|nr:hypothetical protein CETAM_01340 [Corynebacterium comes]
MFHGSSEVAGWLSSPFVFAWDFVTWPFRVVSSHF